MRHSNIFILFVLINVLFIPSTNAQKQDAFLEQLRSLNNEASNCKPSNYSAILEKRNALAANKDAIAEIYLRANELILLDNKLFECANASIVEANSKTATPCPECPTCPPQEKCPDCPPQPKCPECPPQEKCPDCPPQEDHGSTNIVPIPPDCTNQITYMAVGSGAALLLLIFALLNALKAKKWMEEVFDRLHDQILDYFMKRLLAVLKLGEDEKFKKKIELLKELNRDRKIRKISVKDYLASVDEVLVN